MKNIGKFGARAAALWTTALALAAGGGPGAAGPAAAQAREVFEDEEVTVIVPFGAEGGTDRWARFYASFIAEHYPGGPAVEVENAPGRNGPLDAANAFAADDHSDGLTLLALSASGHFPYLLGDERVEFDYDDWEALLVSPAGGVVYAAPELAESYLEVSNLKGKWLRYVAQGPVGLDLVPLLALDLLGARPQAAYGAESRAAGLEAFEDGETLIDFQTTPAYLEHVAPLVRDGDAAPLFSLGVLDRDGALKRDPSFPDLPHFGEAYRRAHGRPPAGKKYDIWKALMAAGFSAQKILAVQKSADPDTLAAHREGLRAILADADFERAAAAALGRYPQHVDASARRMKNLALGVSDRARNEIGYWLVTDALPRWAAPGDN